MTLVESRQPRSPTRAQERLRDQAAEQRARAIVATMGAALDDTDDEMAFAVLRKVVRDIAASMRKLGSAGRALGVANGVSIGLAVEHGTTYRREAEQLFKGASNG